MGKKWKSLSVALPLDVNEQLESMVKRTGILKANLVRSWIFEKLAIERKHVA